MVNGRVIHVKTGKSSGKTGSGIVYEYLRRIFNFIPVSFNITILKLTSVDFIIMSQI